ncbi:hypothetical protein OIU76_016661 [Salix suchowensis]|nr:hypothetical protein OIU76_016661 [Salix suchowensis]
MQIWSRIKWLFMFLYGSRGDSFMFFSYESLVSSYLISHFQTNPGYAYRALCINKRKSLRYLHK